MLNWAARYYPIVRILKQHGLFRDASLLEIGSGAVGIGHFRKVPFVGCDIAFAFEPAWPMTPVTASATDLPMKDKEFDVVLASDVLEHIPPDLRATVVSESLRVARKLAIFGFPCGPLAWQADKSLFNTYVDAGKQPPGWLAEHMEAPFPDTELLPQMDGWDVQWIGNESIRFHSWLMRKEMSYRFVLVSSFLMRLLPSILEVLLRRADRPPFYRQLAVFSRRETP